MYIYENGECMGEIIGDVFETSRSLFGIHQAYFLGTSVIDQLKKAEVKWVHIKHKGGGKNKGKEFRAKLTDFDNSVKRILNQTPNGDNERGLHYWDMEVIKK